MLLLEDNDFIELIVVATGSHLLPEIGSTIEHIKRDSFSKIYDLEMIVESEGVVSIASSISKGLEVFTEFFIKNNIDYLLVLGDRFEIFSAVLSSRINGIPIIHLSGGDTTDGAIDNEFRHSISIMSDIHFVKIEEHKKKLIDLGVNKNNIEIVGSLSVENFSCYRKMSLKNINDKFGISISKPFAIVSFHPVTNPNNYYDNDIEAFINTLFLVDDLFIVFTSSSVENDGLKFNSIIKRYVENNHSHSAYVCNFGRDAYFSLLSETNLMIGNSSSGLLESAMFKLPVVNVLPRQQGRLHNGNVISVNNKKVELLNAINVSLTEEFINKCMNIGNIFNPDMDVQPSEYVADRITSWISARNG